MSVWAIADLHLCLGAPDKSMELFGWHKYMERMEESWRCLVAPTDLVLLPGDISWAMRLSDALKDLEWIDQLPGTKVMIKGNHDYWWGSPTKVRAALPPSLHIIQNDAFHYQDVTIGGTRLWDVPGLTFGDEAVAQKEDDKKIFNREIERLKLSINCLHPQTKKRIVMTHYPPISADLQESVLSKIFEENQIDLVIFGHLHHVSKELPLFGIRNGVTYQLVAADYLDFTPIKLL